MNIPKVERLRKAAELLASHGINVDQSRVEEAVAKNVNVSRSDYKAFARWAKSTWPTGRFIVSWTKRGRLAFHSPAAFEAHSAALARAREVLAKKRAAAAEQKQEAASGN